MSHYLNKYRDIPRAYRIFWSFVPYLKKHRIKLAFLAGIVILNSLIGTFTPLLLKFMVDDVLPVQKWSLFWIITGGYFTLSIAMEGVGVFTQYLSMCMREEIYAQLSTKYLHQLLQLPYAETQQKQAGAHIFRATQDVSLVVGLLTSFFTGIIGCTVSLVTAIVIMLSLQWKFTLAYLIFVPIVVMLRVWISLKLKPLQEKMREANEGISGFVGQTVSAIKVIKTCQTEIKESQRYLRIQRDKIRLTFRIWLTEMFLTKIQWLLESGTGSMLQWCIWFLVMKQYTSLGSAMAISWYFGMIVGPFTRLAGSVQRIISGMVPGGRVLQTMQAEKESLYTGRKLRNNVNLGIRFRDVSFAYCEGNDVLKSISMDFLPGQITALVGPSGSGKTTIINLICGLYSGYRGAIEIDGVEQSTIAISSLRKMISLVPQDPFLLEASVADNIKYGKNTASADDIAHAAKSSGIHDRIMQLDDGYDTVIKPGKCDFSVGERQRLVIARAIFRNSPIIIFDEASSNLDARTETHILSTLTYLKPGKTIILITHRLNTLDIADAIITIKNGEIDNSSELMSQTRAFQD